MFYVSSSIGSMTTNLVAAGIYKNLNGTQGLSGWRWMYIVASLITIPIVVFGYATFPGTPDHARRWMISEEEFRIARERLAIIGRKEPVGIKWKLSSIKRFVGHWHFWVLVPWNVLWLTGFGHLAQGALTLWLKSVKKYTVVQINNYSVSTQESYCSCDKILTFS